MTERMYLNKQSWRPKGLVNRIEQYEERMYLNKQSWRPKGLGEVCK